MRRDPDVEIMTGSKTTQTCCCASLACCCCCRRCRRRSSCRNNPTVSTKSLVPSMPILTASGGKSLVKASSCCWTNSMGGTCTAVTPTEFCAVKQVTTLQQWNPKLDRASKSAWIPAPPPESDPAMVYTMGRCCCPSGETVIVVIVGTDMGERYGSVANVGTDVMALVLS
jgi:hypothetical protein